LRNAKGRLAALLAVLCVWLASPPAFAQAPPVPVPPGPPVPAAPGAVEAGAAMLPGRREMQIKLTFATFDQFSYQQHPFFSLSKDDLFRDGEAGGGSSALIGSVASDEEANFVEKVIHALPPFGVEYTWNFDFRFPRGIGVGLDYVHIAQTDRDAAGKRPPPTLPRFEMDTFYIAVPVRFYGFDPREEGINYFIGFSLGLINGNLLVKGTGPSGEDEAISFSESAVGATRMGIEVTGMDFGFRYEVMLINPREVKFDRNPFPVPATETELPTTIDMSGSLIRMSLFYKFR
jgi:hypothetical protein